MARLKRTDGRNQAYTEALANNPANNRVSGSSYSGGPRGRRRSKRSRKSPKQLTKLQEQRWASLSGPVVVRIDPSIMHKEDGLAVPSPGKSRTPKDRS